MVVINGFTEDETEEIIHAPDAAPPNASLERRVNVNSTKKHGSVSLSL